MRFPCVFSRWKGVTPAGAITIGSGDTDPPDPAVQKGDNLLSYGYSNINGWPVHRIAVIYVPKTSETKSVTGTMYVFEEETKSWCRISPADVAIAPRVVTFFDAVSVKEPADVAKGAGSAKVKLIIKDPNGVADGEYLFAMAPDLTTIGYP